MHPNFRDVKRWNLKKKKGILKWVKNPLRIKEFPFAFFPSG